ncbi:DUF3181 family protein [Candidatus Cyanaurora vandensis]|uniref:DUF3181 family protein n=1 Tax=Candidatus Cyanaurora vandensis TaxID=2714958 RepID=UPI00257AE4BC|nr:DUF3181 family protein [Candidatus Cyanaurora vandensis]
MNLSRDVEKLAASLGADIYLEIARWRLTLADAHLDKSLATQLRLVADRGRLSESQLEAVLNQIMVPIGDGGYQVPLGQFLSLKTRQRVLEILEEVDRD